MKKCDPILGGGRYACEGGNCYPSANGPYPSLTACQQQCGHTRFRCQNGNCFPDPTGPFASMADCQQKCDPRGGGRWKCVEGGNCVPHPSGPYTSQSDCMKKCNPQGGNRFNCDKSGNCYPDANGPFATMAECQKKCDRGVSRRMKDCYDCNRKGGKPIMTRIPWNQPCPKGWTSAEVNGATGLSRNPCITTKGVGGVGGGKGNTGRPATRGESNFSGMWFNEEY